MSDLPDAKRQRRAPSDKTRAGETNEDASPISMLPDAVLDSIFSFVSPGQYRFIAGTNRRFRRVYESNRSRTKDTFWAAAATSVSCAELVLEDYKLLGKAKSDCTKALFCLFRKATALGNVGVLEWARQKGVEVGPSYSDTVGRSGHIAVLEWFDSINYQWNYFYLFSSAAGAGHVHVFEWISSINGLHRDALREAANNWFVWVHAGRGGHVALLEWIKNNNLIPSDDSLAIWRFASSGGCVNVLDWLVENGHEVPNDDPDIVNSAARSAHFPVLQWCRDHGCTFTADACAFAASEGRLDTLQWLRENDCPWDGRVLAWAEYEGYDHIVEWAQENGCPEPESESESESDEEEEEEDDY